MELNKSKEWFRKNAEAEGDTEIRIYSEAEKESECFQYGCKQCFPELTDKDGNK
jgi:hypothetical protein